MRAPLLLDEGVLPDVTTVRSSTDREVVAGQLDEARQLVGEGVCYGLLLRVGHLSLAAPSFRRASAALWPG